MKFTDQTGGDMENLEQRLAAIELRLSVLEARASSKQFKPPTADEVAKYLFNKNQNTMSALIAGIIAQDFWDYYQSNGWMVGRVKMKSWMHAADRWLRNQPKHKLTTNGTTNTPSYHKPI